VHREDAIRRVLRSVESSFLALKGPPFVDSLDPHRGEVDRHAVLEPRAEQRVHVRVGWPIHPAVLVDGVTPFDLQSESAEALETSYRKDLRLYCGFGVTSRAVDEPTTAGPAGSSREGEPAGRDGLALASHVGRLPGP
jgi:hypothetical protein